MKLRQSDPEEEEPESRSLCIAEIVSELVYANKPLSDIAGYDSLQMSVILFRKRDKYGSLVRKSNLPKWVQVDEEGQWKITRPVSYGSAFRRAKMDQGLTRAEAEQRWTRFQEGVG